MKTRAKKAHAGAQAAYRERMRSRGLVQVTLWVPERIVEGLKAYAADLVRKQVEGGVSKDA